jgi:hypothetical protein
MAGFGRRGVNEDDRWPAPATVPPSRSSGIPRGVIWVVLALGVTAVLALVPRLMPYGYLAARSERARLESVAREGQAQEVQPGLRLTWTDRCGRAGLGAMRGGPSVNRATGLNSFDEMMICRLDEAASHLCSPAVREQLAAHIGVYLLGYVGTALSMDETYDTSRDFSPLFPQAVTSRLRDLASKGLLDADDLKLAATAPLKKTFQRIVAGVRVTPICKT